MVSALAARDLPDLETFNIGYARNSEVFQANPRRIVGEVVGDDAHYARLAAKALGTRHRAFTLPLDSLLDDIDRMIWHREKPLVTLSEYGHFHLSRQVRRHVKVLLSGQGSDELFGGYYYWWQFKDPARTTFFPWVWRTDPKGADYPVTAVDIMESLASPEFREATRYREAQQAVFDGIYSAAATDDFMNRISYLLVKTHLHEMLELEDRHSMAASLEIRVPYLDHHIVEWALNLPRAAKTSGRTEKELLRTMARDHIPGFPAEVIARKKSPMPPPFDIQGLVAAMVDRLRRPGRALDSILDGQRLDAFLLAFDREAVGLVHQRHYALFSLYFLERWHQVFHQGMNPLRQILAEARAAGPQRPALVHDGRHWSYAELSSLADETGRALRKRGVGAGSRVGVRLPNSPDLVAAYMAIWGLDAVVVEASPSLGPSEQEALFRFSGVAATVGIEQGGSPAAATGAADGAPRADGQPVACVNLTSGTTGAPKGVLLPPRNLLRNAELFAKYFGLRPEDRTCLVLPLYFGMNKIALLAHLRLGATVILESGFATPNTALAAMGRESATGLCAVPAACHAMLARGDLQRYPQPHLRYLRIGAGRVSAALMEGLRRAFPATDIYTTYGLTEIGLVTCLSADEHARRPDSVGRPIEEVEVTVTGGGALPGEVVVRGDHAAIGYWGDRDATAEVFREDGIHTGDLGRLDEARLPVPGRPSQGADQERRGERPSRRGRGGAAGAPGGRGLRGRRDPRPVARRGGAGLRGAAAGGRRRWPGADAALRAGAAADPAPEADRHPGVDPAQRRRQGDPRGAALSAARRVAQGAAWVERTGVSGIQLK